MATYRKRCLSSLYTPGANGSGQQLQGRRANRRLPVATATQGKQSASFGTLEVDELRVGKSATVKGTIYP